MNIKGIILLCLWMTFFNPQVVFGSQSSPIDGAKLSSEVFDLAMERLRSYYEVSVVVTAYAVNDGHTPGTTMASGKQVYVGAAAYNDVPLGTKVVIDGMEYTVEDRMMDDGYIDIFMDSVTAAEEWGVQRKIVKVKE